MRGRNELARGIARMLTSALLTCVGQLLWKLAAGGSLWLLLGGFALYGVGALMMILALRCGELSVLHPMLGAGYALSLLFGSVFLQETLSAAKLTGVLVITAGLVLLAGSGEVRR